MKSVGWIGLALSVFGLLSLAVSGPGHRLGWWDYRIGISLVVASGILSLAGVVVCLVSLALWKTGRASRGVIPALCGLLLGGMLAGVMLMWIRTLDSVPQIHDITTDTDNPPQFIALIPLRAGAENSIEYGGPDLARQQKDAYPDVKPGSVNRPPAEAFPCALRAVQHMGWEIAASDMQAQRIEATDTTYWFGFKDDIVVRLTPMPTGTRIDVRSVSRVGQSDLGTNARRIQAYLTRVKLECDAP